MRGENTEVLEGFGYFGSLRHKSTVKYQEAFRWTDMGYAVMTSYNASIWCRRFGWRKTKILVLLYSCETWTFSSEWESHQCLHRIMENCLRNRVRNDRLLREANLSLIICTIRQRQLRLQGHVTDLLEANSAH